MSIVESCVDVWGNIQNQLLQNLTYDASAAEKTQAFFSSTMSEPLCCSTEIRYYSDSEFTGFTSTWFPTSTIEVEHIFRTHVHTYDTNSWKVSICLCCHFQKKADELEMMTVVVSMGSSGGKSISLHREGQRNHLEDVTFSSNSQHTGRWIEAIKVTRLFKLLILYNCVQVCSITQCNVEGFSCCFQLSLWIQWW